MVRKVSIITGLFGVSSLASLVPVAIPLRWDNLIQYWQYNR